MHCPVHLSVPVGTRGPALCCRVVGRGHVAERFGGPREQACPSAGVARLLTVASHRQALHRRVTPGVLWPCCTLCASCAARVVSLSSRWPVPDGSVAFGPASCVCCRVGIWGVAHRCACVFCVFACNRLCFVCVLSTCYNFAIVTPPPPPTAPLAQSPSFLWLHWSCSGKVRVGSSRIAPPPPGGGRRAFWGGGGYPWGGPGGRFVARKGQSGGLAAGSFVPVLGVDSFDATICLSAMISITPWPL